MNPLSNSTFGRDVIRFLLQIPEVEIVTKERTLTLFTVPKAEKAQKGKKEKQGKQEDKKKRKSIYDIAKEGL